MDEELVQAIAALSSKQLWTLIKDLTRAAKEQDKLGGETEIVLRYLLSILDCTREIERLEREVKEIYKLLAKVEVEHEEKEAVPPSGQVETVVHALPEQAGASN